MKTLQKGILIFLIAIVFSWLTMAWFGKFYEKIIGHGISSWIGTCAECYEGFFMAYFFAVSVLVFVLVKTLKTKSAVLAALLLPFFAILLF